MGKILNTKVWLLIIALMHSIMGVIVNYQQAGSPETLAVYIFFGIISIYLFYAALMTKGKEQARLAVVLCAPVLGWFIVSALMGLEMNGVPVAKMPEAVMPIFLWTMPTLCGLKNWNAQ